MRWGGGGGGGGRSGGGDSSSSSSNGSSSYCCCTYDHGLWFDATLALIHTMYRLMIGWLMDWRPWPYWGTPLAFDWSEWRKPQTILA